MYHIVHNYIKASCSYMLPDHLLIFLSLCCCLGCLHCLSFVHISHMYCVIKGDWYEKLSCWVYKPKRT